VCPCCSKYSTASDPINPLEPVTKMFFGFMRLHGKDQHGQQHPRNVDHCLLVVYLYILTYEKYNSSQSLETSRRARTTRSQPMRGGTLGKGGLLFVADSTGKSWRTSFQRCLWELGHLRSPTEYQNRTACLRLPDASSGSPKADH